MKIPSPAAALALCLWSLSGCSGGSGGSTAGGERSSMLVLSAVPGGGSALSAVLSLGNGELDVQSALLRIARVEIEEHTDRRGDGPTDRAELDDDDENENENENDDGDDDGEQNEGAETEDIVVEGPFTLDVAKGGTVIDSVPVYPGTFHRVDLFFQVSDGAPFSGNSIVISGAFRPTNAAPVPFTLRSTFAGRMRAPIAGGGITVGENAIVPVSITFDLAALLGNLDMASATVVGGEITIDASSNPALLAAFEQNFRGGCMETREHSR